jgi:glutamate-1-semialdehyde 2,1-aminomutase
MAPTYSPIEIVANRIAYQNEDSISRRLFHHALRVMPGGNSRHSTALAPYPVYVSRGKGSRIVDVEGQERIDFLNNFTSLILGHANEEVTKVVQERVGLGTAFTMPTQLDIELADLLINRVPYIHRIRFCNSGSEAVMLAVRAARAFTGRHKIAKFEGAYHGIYDYVQVSECPTPNNWGDVEAPASVVEPSISPNSAADVVVLPWNNFEVCERLLDQYKNELAAVVVDPLPLGIGMISPLPGFIEFLREKTEKNGVLLIADEVLTFRLSYYGAMYEFGVHPDLTALGKIIGGGFPVGAVAGKPDVMSVFDHTGNLKVRHGGTYNANPVTMTAGLKTMNIMTPDVYDMLNRMGDCLRAQIKATLEKCGLPVTVCGKGSLFLVHLTNNELVDFRSLVEASPALSFYEKLCHEMLARGIVISSRSIFGCLSTPMTETELDIFVVALASSLKALT